MDKNVFQKLHERLELASENRRQLRKLEAVYQNLWSSLKKEEARAESLQNKLTREWKDAGRLESKTLEALFYSILGTKEQYLEKERQQFLVARLNFEACMAQLENIRRDLRKTQLHLDELSRSEQEYHEALKAKEAALMFLSEDGSIQLKRNFEEVCRTQEESKQIIEAIAAGEMVIRELDPMLEALMSARDWGTLDMFGGGLLVTAAKHSKVDEAREHMYRVQHSLYYFNHELADLKQGDFVIRFDRFTTFADYFFDGLLMDWVVQNGINRSLSNTRELYRLVHQTVGDLKARHEACNIKSRSLLQKREELIQTL